MQKACSLVANWSAGQVGSYAVQTSIAISTEHACLEHSPDGQQFELKVQLNLEICTIFFLPCSHHFKTI